MELPLLPAVLNWQTFPERSLLGALPAEYGTRCFDVRDFAEGL